MNKSTARAHLRRLTAAHALLLASLDADKRALGDMKGRAFAAHCAGCRAAGAVMQAMEELQTITGKASSRATQGAGRGSRDEKSSAD